MTHGARLSLALAVATGVVASVAAEAGDSALLTEVSVHLQAARYAPTETAFKWDGWIGGGVGLLRVDGVTLYGTADVETIIGGEKRTFDANQANYHLEGGLRRAIGGGEARLFFHHVSRHYVDRPKTQAVDWNVLGLGVKSRFPGGLPGRFAFGIGHTTQASLVAYRWEATAEAELDLVPWPTGAAYLESDARFVTREPSAVFPEKRFVDFKVEGGLRFTRGSRTLRAFVAWDHRNDALLELPGVKDRALIGLRIGFGEQGIEARPTSGASP
jgi:hypothetical protein